MKFRSAKITQTRYGSWRVEYRYRGDRRRKSYPDREFAETMKDRINYFLSLGKDPEYEMERAERMAERSLKTLAEYVPLFEQRHYPQLSSKTKKAYRNSFANLFRCNEFKNRPISEIDKGLVMDYRNARIEQDGVKNRTVNIEVGHLNCLLNRAVEWGDLERNPLAGLKKLKESGRRDVVLDSSQVKELLNELPQLTRDMLGILLDSGLRKGELLSLRIEEIQFSDLHPMATVNKITKGGKRRNIICGPAAVEILKRVIGKRKEELVFINPETGNQYVSIHKGFNRAVRKLGLTAVDGSKFRIHDARHLIASALRADGMSIEDIQTILGHDHSYTTAGYIKPDLQAVGERMFLIRGKK